MNDFDKLDTYNGDPEHEMWVDYNKNTGKSSNLFDETDFDQFIDNLNDRD